MRMSIVFAKLLLFLRFYVMVWYNKENPAKRVN